MRFQGITRAVGNTVLSAKRNSPHIYFAGGIGGILVSHFLVARATLKLEPVLDDIRDDLASVKRSDITLHGDDRPVATPEVERGRELTRVYLNSALKLGKLYGPAFIVGSVSIAALSKSHIEMNRRNAALAAAYTGIAQMFDEYRERVRQEVGDDKEQDIYLGVQEHVIEEDGKRKKVAAIEGLPSPYARMFDSYSHRWEPDPEKMRYFLQMQQNYWNQRLQTYGHVFLNEVYDSLGLERTPEGAIMGWKIASETGDGFIDFGLYEAHEGAKFLNAKDWCALLDFNVDRTPMYNKI